MIVQALLSFTTVFNNWKKIQLKEFVYHNLKMQNMQQST